MILTQTIRKLIYLFVLIPNIIIKSPLYCSYICRNNMLFNWNHKGNSRKSASFQQITQYDSRASPQQGGLIPYNHCFSKTSPCGPIPHNHLARALMPRQPYSEAVKSDRRSGYILSLLRRAEAWRGMWSSLWLKGDGGIRKKYTFLFKSFFKAFSPSYTTPPWP